MPARRHVQRSRVRQPIFADWRPVQHNVLDHNGRRLRRAGAMQRLGGYGAHRGGEPKQARFGFQASRKKSPGAFRSRHSISPSIKRRIQGSQNPRRPFVQLELIHAGDPALAAEPKLAGVIFEDLIDGIVLQSLASGQGGDAAIAPPTQAAAAGADPQRLPSVQIKCADRIAKQAVLLAIMNLRIFFEAIQASAIGADPQRTVRIWNNGADRMSFAQFGLLGPPALGQLPKRSLACTRPDAALGIFSQGNDGEVRQPYQSGFVRDGLRIFETQQPARVSDQATAILRHQQRIDLGVAQRQAGGSQAVKGPSLPAI